MFGFIVFGWMLFAAPSLDWVIAAFSNPITGSVDQQAVAIIGLSITLIYSIPMIAKIVLDRYVAKDSIVHSMYYAVATATIFIYVNSATPDFIYFQF